MSPFLEARICAELDCFKLAFSGRYCTVHDKGEEPRPFYESTALGDQAVVPGAVGRILPTSGIKAKRRQATGAGPLFDGPEPEQLSIEGQP